MRKPLAAAVALASFATAPAWAGLPFDQFIGFGASYDDSGNFPDIELDPSHGLRFTNIDPLTGERGRSFPEWLAIDLGIGEMNPSSPLLFGPRNDTVDTDNVNFAVGGYRSEQVLESVVGTQVVSFGPFSNSQPGFLQRVAAGTLTFGPNTLFYANPAGNDIRDVDDPQQTADVSAQIVQALVDAGANYIVLPTLPKLGNFAELTNFDANGRTQRALDRTAAALAFNAAFEQHLNGMEGNFIRVDVTTFFDEVLADPGSFGLASDLDQSTVCYNSHALGNANGCQEPPGRGLASGGDPDDFIFYDGLHPTQASAHAAADLIESVIRAPGFFTLVPEAVLSDARGYRNALDDQLTQMRWGQGGDTWRLFASVQGREFEIDDAHATPAVDSDSSDLTIGASVTLGDGWFAGAALGSQSSEADIDDMGSGFDTDGLTGSLFAGYRCDIWFADAVLSLGQSDVEDMTRVFNIGSTMVRTEQGETEADVLGLAGDIGINMMSSDSSLRFGPFLGFDWLDIDVDGYAEEGASSSAMAFDDLERDSLVGRAGVFASYPMKLGTVALEVHGDVAYFEDFEDDADDVTAVAKNLAAGPWFTMPGYEIDSSGIRASLGLGASWQGGFHVGLAYRYDDNQAQAQYLDLSASFAF